MGRRLAALVRGTSCFVVMWAAASLAGCGESQPTAEKKGFNPSDLESAKQALEKQSKTRGKAARPDMDLTPREKRALRESGIEIPKK